MECRTTRWLALVVLLGCRPHVEPATGAGTGSGSSAAQSEDTAMVPDFPDALPSCALGNVDPGGYRFAPPRLELAPNVAPYELGTGRVDADGVDDLVMLDGGSVIVGYGSPAGPEYVPALTVGVSASGLGLADLDGDGAQEISVSQGPFDRIDIVSIDAERLLVLGERIDTVEPRRSFGARVLAADSLDLVVQGQQPGQIEVFERTTDAFRSRFRLDLGDDECAVQNRGTRLGDFDGDGTLDAVVVAYRTSAECVGVELWFFPDFIAGGRPLAFAELPVEPHTFVAGDFDGDGRDDVAVDSDHELQLFVGTLSGPSLGWAQEYETRVLDAEAVDVDGDGTEDLVVAWRDGSIEILAAWTPDGPRTEARAQGPDDTHGIGVGDYDCNGVRDIAFGSYSGVWMLYGDG